MHAQNFFFIKRLRTFLTYAIKLPNYTGIFLLDFLPFDLGNSENNRIGMVFRDEFIEIPHRKLHVCCDPITICLEVRFNARSLFLA